MARPEHRATGDAPSLVPPNQSYTALEDEIMAIRPGGVLHRRWWLGMTISGLLLAVLVVSVAVLLVQGIGIWGLDVPNVWGLDIVSYAWWIGISNAGLMLAALLAVTSTTWRAPINRLAEAMTLIASLCAAIYPILHLGRPGLFYWVLPYFSSARVWPQFLSPLVWDVFAVLTHLLFSYTFWYVGLMPDLGALRDQAKRGWSKRLFGVLAAGWRGSARDWERWHRTYRLIALIAIPLAVLLQSVVALLLAVGSIAGWNTTLFPALFVAGAMLLGMAVVTLLAITLRTAFRVRDLVTDRHVEVLARLLLATGLAVAYGYLMDGFAAWYSGDVYWLAKIEDRLGGAYAWSTWAAILGNVVAIQLLWSPRVRANDAAVFLIALAAMVGMWFERFALIVTGLYHGYLPAYWDPYFPTAWDWLMFSGTTGLFLFLVLLFIRFLPLFGIVEVRELLEEERLDVTPDVTGGEVDYGGA